MVDVSVANDVIEDEESLDEEMEETWADKLEGKALEIVTSDARRQCVQAGPGTGKSYCMSKRILRLIQQRKVKPREVLAVTFTRTAAADLKKSLNSALGDKHSNFWATTLHSLCFKILGNEKYLPVRKRHPRFLLTVTKSGCLNFEAAPLIADLQHENSEYGAGREQTKRIKEFEALWATRQEDPLNAPGDDIKPRYETAFLNWLKFHKGMMVGELVKEAYAFMASEPDTEWRTKFKAVLVDEYQDLNKLDQEFISLLCSDSRTNCSVVGDLDQSIYSFRCAHLEGLSEYSVKPDVEPHSMEVSRRCPTSHLNAAQSLIKQNTKRAVVSPMPCSLRHTRYSSRSLLPKRCNGICCAFDHRTTPRIYIS